MARKKKNRSEAVYDDFCCTVDRWRREYSHGINRFRWELNPEVLNESDRLVIEGTVRNHDTNRRSNRRHFKSIELWITPTYTPRSQWRKDPEAVGAVWTEKGEKGKLRAGVQLAADVFYSLIPCLAINHFKQFSLKVLNLRYSQGSIDNISLQPEEIPREDLA